jgi:hypothetical protein
MAKAAASPKTPAHLRPHLQKRVQEATMKTRIDNLRRPSGRVPGQQSIRTTDKPDVSEQGPIDPQSFEVNGTDTSSMGTKVGTTRTQPPAAGTRPMNVPFTAKPPKAPGLVASQGRVANDRPAAPGLNQNMRADVRRPRAAGINQTVNPVRKTNKVTGVPAQRNRNVRPGSANPAFYGDF